MSVKMASWIPYRSKEVVWIKPRTGPNGEAQILTKDGKVMPKEVFVRKFEPLEEPPAA